MVLEPDDPIEMMGHFNLVVAGFLLSFVLMLSSRTQGQDAPAVPEEEVTAEKLSQIKVEWYQPEVGETEKRGRSRIIISGKTQAGAQVGISEPKIATIQKDGKVKYLKTEKILSTPGRVQANEKGYFELHLDLPTLSVQVPVSVTYREMPNLTRTFQFNLKVQKQAVEATNLKDLKKSPAFLNKYGLWLGSGFNYLHYLQTSPSIDSNLDFRSLKGPSYYAEAWLWLNEKWDMALSYKVSPGSVTESDDVDIDKGSYDWTTLALEGSYYPPDWTPTFFHRWRSQVGVRFGIQHHTIPFMARTESAINEIEIKTNTLSMGTLGFKVHAFPSRFWTYEAFFRAQYPLAVGDLFEMYPKFAFDGSLGVIRVFKTWQVGAFWYGQWHQYSFTHNDAYYEATDQDSKIDGDQSLFYSNIEIRFGLFFK